MHVVVADQRAGHRRQAGIGDLSQGEGGKRHGARVVSGVVEGGDPASATPVRAAASTRITVKSLTRRLS